MEKELMVETHINRVIIKPGRVEKIIFCFMWRITERLSSVISYIWSVPDWVIIHSVACSLAQIMLSDKDRTSKSNISMYT